MENIKRNILFCKLGRNITFKQKGWGNLSSIITLSLFAKLNPEYTFYVCGPNELPKLSDEQYRHVFPNDNIVDLFNLTPTIDDEKDMYKYLEEHDIHIDYALILTGIKLALSQSNYIKKLHSDEYAKPMIMMHHAAGPTVRLLNKFNDTLPIYTINDDARSIVNDSRDAGFDVKLCFSQSNVVLPQHVRIKSDTDHTLVQRPDLVAEYAYVERIFMAAVPRDWKERIDLIKKLENKKYSTITCIMHGAGCNKPYGAYIKDARLTETKKYLIDNFENTEYANTKIYGNWTDETLAQYPQIEDKRITEIQEEIDCSKYGFVYSITPGFVTVKPWEMIVHGMIPFMHPDYDPKHILGLPEECYIKSPEDLLAKLRKLDSDDSKYVELFEKCKACISDDDISGRRVNNHIFDRIERDFNNSYIERDGLDEPIFNYFVDDAIKEFNKNYHEN